jgi:nucleotide-binding universal stress UspA family protein
LALVLAGVLSTRQARHALASLGPTWEACVDHARALLPGDANVTLVHIAPGDVEELVGGHDRLLGRPAELVPRRGRVERELLDACATADLLVLARDGAHHEGPKSIGPRARFVLDHAPCQVLLVWPEYAEE